MKYMRFAIVHREPIKQESINNVNACLEGCDRLKSKPRSKKSQSKKKNSSRKQRCQSRKGREKKIVFRNGETLEINQQATSARKHNEKHERRSQTKSKIRNEKLYHMHSTNSRHEHSHRSTRERTKKHRSKHTKPIVVQRKHTRRAKDHTKIPFYTIDNGSARRQMQGTDTSEERSRRNRKSLGENQQILETAEMVRDNKSADENKGRDKQKHSKHKVESKHVVEKKYSPLNVSGITDSLEIMQKRRRGSSPNRTILKNRTEIEDYRKFARKVKFADVQSYRTFNQYEPPSSIVHQKTEHVSHPTHEPVSKTTLRVNKSNSFIKEPEHTLTSNSKSLTSLESLAVAGFRSPQNSRQKVTSPTHLQDHPKSITLHDSYAQRNEQNTNVNDIQRQRYVPSPNGIYRPRKKKHDMLFDKYKSLRTSSRYKSRYESSSSDRERATSYAPRYRSDSRREAKTVADLRREIKTVADLRSQYKPYWKTVEDLTMDSWDVSSFRNRIGRHDYVESVVVQ